MVTDTCSTRLPQLEETLLAHRGELLAFIRGRGAGDASEDVLQELWLRLPRVGDGRSEQIRSPLSYLYRAANALLIDRHRQRRQAEVRDGRWSEATGPTIAGHSEGPSADRVIVARQTVEQVNALLLAEGERVHRVFRRHRVDGLTQREVASELGVSIGTVEGDLRRAYAALYAFRAGQDEVPAR